MGTMVRGGHGVDVESVGVRLWVPVCRRGRGTYPLSGVGEGVKPSAATLVAWTYRGIWRAIASFSHGCCPDVSLPRMACGQANDAGIRAIQPACAVLDTHRNDRPVRGAGGALPDRGDAARLSLGEPMCAGLERRISVIHRWPIVSRLVMVARCHGACRCGQRRQSHLADQRAARRHEVTGPSLQDMGPARQMHKLGPN